MPGLGLRKISLGSTKRFGQVFHVGEVLSSCYTEKTLKTKLGQSFREGKYFSSAPTPTIYYHRFRPQLNIACFTVKSQGYLSWRLCRVWLFEIRTLSQHAETGTFTMFVLLVHRLVQEIINDKM